LGLSCRKPENGGENCMMKTCMSCSSTEYFRVIKLRDVKVLGIWHKWERREIYTGLWWENMKERNKLAHIAVDVRAIREQMLKKWDDKLCTGYM
jgi:hypothetical protein